MLPLNVVRPDGTANLVIGDPPSVSHVADLPTETTTTGFQAPTLSVVPEVGAVGGVGFSEQRSRFHSNPISQFTTLTNRPGHSHLDRGRIRSEARSVLDNADLREELEQMKLQMTMLQSQ